MWIWMEVTLDKYEFPVAVADSVQLLARKRGISISTIYTTIRTCAQHGWRCRYRKIWIEDDEDD